MYLLVVSTCLSTLTPYSFGSREAETSVNSLLWFLTLVRFVSWEGPRKAEVLQGGRVAAFLRCFTVPCCSVALSLPWVSVPISCPSYHNPLCLWFLVITSSPPLCLPVPDSLPLKLEIRRTLLSAPEKQFILMILSYAAGTLVNSFFNSAKIILIWMYHLSPARILTNTILFRSS